MKKIFREYKSSNVIAEVYTDDIDGVGGTFPAVIIAGENSFEIPAASDAVNEFLRDDTVSEMTVNSTPFPEELREKGAI